MTIEQIPEIHIGTDLTQISEEELIEWLKMHPNDGGGDSDLYHSQQAVSSYLPRLVLFKRTGKYFISAVVGNKWEIQQ